MCVFLCHPNTLHKYAPHQNCHPSSLYPSPLNHSQSLYMNYYAQATVVSSLLLNTEWPPSPGLFIPGFSGPSPHLLQILAKSLTFSMTALFEIANWVPRTPDHPSSLLPFFPGYLSFSSTLYNLLPTLETPLCKNFGVFHS